MTFRFVCLSRCAPERRRRVRHPALRRLGEGPNSHSPCPCETHKRDLRVTLHRRGYRRLRVKKTHNT